MIIKRILFFSFITLISCQTDNTRNCHCTFKDIPTSIVDSSSTISTTQPISIELEGIIKPRVKKLIEAEAKGKISSSITKVNLKNVIEKISNEMPEHNDIVLRYRFERLIYCQYYELYCQNDSLTDFEFNKKMLDKLEEIETIVDDYFSPNSEPEFSERTIKTIQKQKKYFSLNPFNEKIAELIESNTTYVYKNSNESLKIELKNNGDYIQIREDLYKFSGGTIEVYVGNILCREFSEFKIEKSSRIGNPKKILEESIKQKFKLLLTDNSETIANQISKCL